MSDHVEIPEEITYLLKQLVPDVPYTSKSTLVITNEDEEKTLKIVGEAAAKLLSSSRTVEQLIDALERSGVFENPRESAVIVKELEIPEDATEELQSTFSFAEVD